MKHDSFPYKDAQISVTAYGDEGAPVTGSFVIAIAAPNADIEYRVTPKLPTNIQSAEEAFEHLSQAARDVVDGKLEIRWVGNG